MPSRFQPNFSIFSSGIHPAVRPWLTLSGLLFALLLWNWMLTLATAIALMVGVMVYLVQERRLNLKWFQRSRAWKHHRSLWVALLTGAGGFCATYSVIHIWQEAPLPWLATVILLQSIGTLGVLSILVWERVQRHRTVSQSHREVPRTTTPKRPFRDLLDDLTSVNAVTRLIAVRQIASLAMVSTAKVTDDEMSDDVIVWSVADIRQCLQLMRKHEPELAVQQAIDEAIARLTPNRTVAPTLSQHQPFFNSSSINASSNLVLPIPNLMRTRAGHGRISSPVPEPQSLNAAR